MEIRSFKCDECSETEPVFVRQVTNKQSGVPYSVVSVGRFAQVKNNTGVSLIRLDTNIVLPHSLNLPQFGKPVRRSFIEHWGTTLSEGHYVALVQDRQDPHLLTQFDDHTVSEKRLMSTVKSRGVYVAFYEIENVHQQVSVLETFPHRELPPLTSKEYSEARRLTLNNKKTSVFSRIHTLDLTGEDFSRLRLMDDILEAGGSFKDAWINDKLLDAFAIILNHISREVFVSPHCFIRGCWKKGLTTYVAGLKYQLQKAQAELCLCRSLTTYLSRYQMDFISHV
eukprot:Lithocolla_globosa_v1_NODE_1539_length_2499_cov_4.150573.p1 type:complete len:282 gc:universal NODE_1539_length_2499_cov_4.150573:1707-862(-)